MCIQRSCVTRSIHIKTKYITLLFFKSKKYCGQPFPVKHISVFIDLKHGEFFSITSLFKMASFLKLLLILQVSEPPAEESQEKPSDGEEN